MLEYRCLACGADFETESGCMKHYMETKHENFEIVGLDARINIKGK